MNADRFAPDERGSTALFVDSSAFFAYYYPHDEHHGDAAEFFRVLRRGDHSFRPLFTNDYVLDETITHLRRHTPHEVTADALSAIYESSAFYLEHVTESVVDAVVERYDRYEDHESVSFTDHAIAVQMNDLGVSHVFSYDRDFETFGFTVVPHYEREDAQS